MFLIQNILHALETSMTIFSSSQDVVFKALLFNMSSLPIHWQIINIQTMIRELILCFKTNIIKQWVKKLILHNSLLY